VLGFAAIAGACGGVGTLQPVPTARPFQPTPYVGPTPGTWSGTITFHYTTDYSKDEDSHSGDPGSVYYETYTTHDVIQNDITDTFTIDAADPSDLTYGISHLDLGGTATASGSQTVRHVSNWDKQNSGCTWKEEDGDEITGSWSSTGVVDGDINFADDGSYSIEPYASRSGPNGEVPEGPKVPHRMWLKYSDISAGCDVNQAPSDITEDVEPGPLFASEKLHTTDVNGNYALINGQLDAANPGSSVDGSSTWDFGDIDGTLDITWHLVHSGPIPLR